MPESADVSAGDDVLASQYNNLRKDVLDAVLGHRHTGLAGGGAIVGSPLFPDLAGLVGDGSDGDLVIGAPTTFDEMKKFNNLTVNALLEPAAGLNFLAIFVKGTLAIGAAGSISAEGFGGIGAGNGPNQGGDGFISSGLENVPGEILGAQNLGEDGRRSMAQMAAATDAGENLYFAYGGGGGGGGQGGGKGGGVWAGGGHGGVTSSGSNGGGGGGVVIIFADTIVIAGGGKITANGADSGGSVGSTGGGGGGGLVYLAYKTLTNDGTISANGGVGGPAGDQQGTDGADGVVAKKVIPG